MVEKALDQCATEHQINVDNPHDSLPRFSEHQPTRLKLDFTFEFDNSLGGESGVIVCCPVVGLSQIKEDDE